MIDMMDKENKINLEHNIFAEKTIIISKSGFGKSYTTRVMIEEGLKLGHSFIIIDPQDAYLNMPQFVYIYAELVKSPKGLGLLLSQTNKNIVIRTKRMDIKKQNLFLNEMLTEYRRTIRKGIQTIVIDEIHKFAPEQEKTEAKDVVRGMFQENRSDGLGIIGISQRVARVDKTIISQADNLAIGRVTSHVDKNTVREYLDNPDDIEKIKVLEKGSFYLLGFGLDVPDIVQIRESETKHSGNSPQNILTEDKILYDEHIGKYVKNYKGGNMADEIQTSNEIVPKIVPSMDGFLDLAGMGAKMALGGAVSGMVGKLVGDRVKYEVPYVGITSRTLGSAGATIVMYTGYRNIDQPMAKDVLKYACAGSAVYTVGSLAYDILDKFNVRVPDLVNTAIVSATGATPLSAGKNEEDANVDVNTQFA